MNLTCVYCSWIGLLTHFEKDHIIPLSRGGADVASNVRWICSGCNRQKGDKTHEEYLIWRILNPFLKNFGLMREGRW